jgi:hypothetical protein
VQNSTGLEGAEPVRRVGWVVKGEDELRRVRGLILKIEKMDDMRHLKKNSEMG